MTLQEALDRMKERLDEEAPPIYWTDQELVDALNYSQRFFCLLTLCLEKIANLTLSASAAFHNIISHATTPIADFLLPLRATIGGVRLKPMTVHQLNMLDPFWTRTPETAVLDLSNTLSVVPKYYVVLGCDLLAVYPQDDAGATLALTYAAAPTALTLAGLSAVFEIPVEYHPCLPDYAIYLLINKVGGQEFANEIPKLKSFLGEAAREAGRVREKMKAQGYERMPFDLDSIDLTPLLRVKLSNQGMPTQKRAA